MMGEFDGMPDWMVERIMQKKTAHERLNRKLPDNHPEVQQMKMMQQEHTARFTPPEGSNPVDEHGVPAYGPLADAVREAAVAERDRHIENIRNNIHPERGRHGRDLTAAKLAAVAKWKAENPDG